MTKISAVVSCPNVDHDLADQHFWADCVDLLDQGFTSKHRYFYYCGDQVTAEPEYLDDGWRASNTPSLTGANTC